LSENNEAFIPQLIMHTTGNALYEHNIAKSIKRTPNEASPDITLTKIK
jgi:hypothetical protein